MTVYERNNRSTRYRDHYGMLRGWVIALMMAVTIPAVIAVIFVVVVVASRTECERTAAAMGIEERWGFWEGCLVVHDGTVVDIDELRRIR